MGSVMMSIGNILFYRPYPGEDTPAFETISREMTATLPVQGRLGRDDAVQFTGPGAEVISVHGRMFPYIFGGLNTMDALRDALRAGKPLLVTQFSPNMSSDSGVFIGGIYSGSKIGNYMIRNLKKQNTLYTSDGIPMKVDFTLELVLYGDDLGPIASNNAVTPTPTAADSTAPPVAGTATPDGTSFSLWSDSTITTPTSASTAGIGSA